MSDYSEVCKKLVSLVNGVPHPIANLANASALLWQELEDLNWAGFYLSEGAWNHQLEPGQHPYFP